MKFAYTIAVAALLATSLHTPALAQSKKETTQRGSYCDDNPGTCAFGVFVGTLALVLGATASVGSDNDDRCDERDLVRAPEGGYMHADPDCR